MFDVKFGLNYQIFSIHANHVAIFIGRHPFDHVAIQTLPAIHEQSLLGKVVLRIQDQNFRFWLVCLEVMRHHAGTFIRSGWASKGIGRCDH